MALIRTYQSLCDDIRSQVDREGDSALGNDVLQPWISQARRKARMEAAQLAPDEYTEILANVNIASGNTFEINPVLDVALIRAVQRTDDAGAHWWNVPRARLALWGNQSRLSYVRRGRTLEFLPAELAPGSYRLLYISRPSEMPTDLSEDEFAPGEDEYVVADVASRCRRRFEEDPVLELAARNDALETMRKYFRLQQPPEPIVGANAWDEDDVW